MHGRPRGHLPPPPSAGDHPAGVVSTHMCRFEILLRGFVDRATSVRLNFFPIEDLDFEY